MGTATNADPPKIDSTRSNVVPLTWQGSDEALLERMRRDPDGGAALLCERFGPKINGLVWSLLGPDPELDDVVHDVYIAVLAGVRRVRDASKLHSWVYSVTVRTVRWELRKRVVRRKRYFAQAEMDRYATAAGDVDVEGREQLRYLFGIVERLSVEQRLAFSLRHIHRQTLPAVASMCGCSLTTVKRRLGRAEKRIAKLAERDDGLRERLVRGSWKSP